MSIAELLRYGTDLRLGQRLRIKLVQGTRKHILMEIYIEKVEML
jgi:hypothetical protein